MSDEFARLATKEARAAKVHEAAVAWGEARKVPAAGASAWRRTARPFFDPQKWKVVYCAPALAAKEATNAVWDLLLATGVHEMRHAQQWIDMARVALGRGHRRGGHRREARDPRAAVEGRRRSRAR